jgi:hypothetical protein
VRSEGHFTTGVCCGREGGWGGGVRRVFQEEEEKGVR